MLHTRVRCRARDWEVLALDRQADGSTWHVLGAESTPRVFASPPDVVDAVTAAPRRVSRRGWMHQALALARHATPCWWPQHARRLPIEPLPWQFLPAMLVLSGRHRRLLVADAVGAGKTIEAAILLHEIHARHPQAATLVVVPPGLLVQWGRQLRDLARLETLVLDGRALNREALWPIRRVDAMRAGACWLTSIDLLRQPEVTMLLARTPWTLLVVDEAHGATPGSARRAAIDRLAASSARVLLLTATPTAAGPTGADSLRAIGARRGEALMGVLKRTPPRPHDVGRRQTVLRVGLDRPHAALCRALDAFARRAARDSGADGLLPALVLRRRAASCPAALVRSLERRLVAMAHQADHLPPARSLFARNDDEDDEDAEWVSAPAWRDRRAEYEELSRLLRLASHLRPAGRRLEVAARLLRRAREPAVLFTTYVDTLRAMAACLPAHRLALVHGRQPDALRHDAVDAFVRGDVDVLLATDAAAEGLNLHRRCRLVVHLDLPPSARVLAQRSGRVDRFGQQRRVHIVLLCADAEADREALARLETRTREDKDWGGAPAHVDERRARVAAWWLGRPQPVRTAPHSELRCSVRPARWRRLLAFWDLPPWTVALHLSTIAWIGRAPLAAVQTVVVRPSGPVEAQHVDETTVRLLLPALAARASRLSRRMARWQDDALAHAVQTRARLDAGDLFAAGEPEPARSTPATGELYVSMPTHAVLQVRHGLSAVARRGARS